jgi:hypothetical protein
MDLLYHENRKSRVRFSWFRSKRLNVAILLGKPLTFRVLVGSWSRDIRLRGEFAVR